MVSLAEARRFDLHLHTDRSDGAWCPEEMIERCLEGGLEAVALTDHDLSTALRPGPHCGGGRSLTLIAGAELSGVHEGREYHLLVYFPREVPDSFRDLCVHRAKERAVRYGAAVDSIGLPGLPEVDDAAAEGARALTRHHLARGLVHAGHASDVRDAFRRYADMSHGHVSAVSLPFVDAIRLATEAGGVTSWAHPPRHALDQHLDTFAAAGLHGLEAYRPMISSRDRRILRKRAKRHGLFLTGGSDCHGWHGERPGLFSCDRFELGGFLDALDAVA